MTNILYINQFPDLKADAAAGKRHWVVRLGALRARCGYVALACAAFGWLAAAVLAGLLPPLALIGLLPAALSVKAARELWMHAAHPQRLAPAIRMTIGAACAHGLLVSIALVLPR